MSDLRNRPARPRPEPEDTEGVEGLRLPGSPTRCPFCHDDVATQGAVACGECLARHHEECWNEQGVCASCRSAVRLVPDQGTAAKNMQELAAGAGIAQGLVLALAAILVAFGRPEAGVMVAFTSQPAFALFYAVRLVTARRGRGAYAMLLALSVVAAAVASYVHFGAGSLGLVYVLPIAFLVYGFRLQRLESEGQEPEQPARLGVEKTPPSPK